MYYKSQSLGENICNASEYPCKCPYNFQMAFSHLSKHGLALRNEDADENDDKKETAK